MSGIKDQEKMEDVRKRLYERGQQSSPVEHHALEDTPVENVPKTFSKSTAHTTQTTTVPEKPVSPKIQQPMPEKAQEPIMSPRPKKRSYRIKILLAGVAFFIIAVLASSIFLLFGNNNISSQNISLSVTGPFTIGGGETLPIQVGVTNANAVPIEAATLIVTYPAGTKSATEEQKDLFTERLQLDTIASGETLNVPLRAVVFGEESEEKTILVSIEYRVQGSNAQFFKEAEPLRFKISSSPVSVSADSVKKISSGQETDIELTITSNSPTPLSEVVIKAEYPLGFDYSTSEPEPFNGQNTWLLENVEPESTHTITVRGIVVGKETDEYAINFTVGVPSEKDKQSLASVFATAQTVFEIEQPFLDVALEVNGSPESSITIDPGDRSRATIDIANTLQDAIYDTVVEVKLSGNAFSVFDVIPSGGFFDPSQNTIRWDVSNTSQLESIRPGDTVRLSFVVSIAEESNNTPQLDIAVNARARRVSESSVSEELTGAVQTIVKVASTPTVRGEAGFNNGIFTDSGPIPPEVGTPTTYSLSLMVDNGSNDITDTVVTTTLPPYVIYLDETAGAGTFKFNASNRVLEWNAGSVDANSAAFASFQISYTPLVTQVGTTPTLMGEQRVRAMDRFTGTIVRATNPAITTYLSSEAGFGQDNGQVQP